MASLCSGFTFAPSSPGVGDTVTFNGSSSTVGAGATIDSYSWDFGDGSTATGVLATHSYAAASTYGATVTITDSLGRVASKTFAITVVP